MTSVIPLLVGGLLGVIALGFVLWPLWTDATRGRGRSSPSQTTADGVDVAEAAIRLQRARRRGCASCGPRPEPDAVFCSNCGRYLSDSCIVCEAPLENVAARFCTRCGMGFAA